MEMRQIIRHPRGMRRSPTGNGPVSGYTLIELTVTIGIAMVLAAISVPLISNVKGYFQFRQAVSTVTGAIQLARTQAIFQGCPYQTVFSAANKTYQTQGEPASAATNTCAVAFTCPGGAATCANLWAGLGSNITLDADQTLTFSPGGTMASASAVNGVTTMVISYPRGNNTATIKISRFGNINVQYQ